MAGRGEDNGKEGHLKWLTPWASLALLILATGIVLNGDAYDREADRLEVHSLQTVDAELRGNLSALRQEEELDGRYNCRPQRLSNRCGAYTRWGWPQSLTRRVAERQEGALDEHLVYPRGAIRAEEGVDRLSARLAPVLPAAPVPADGGEPVRAPETPVQEAEVPLAQGEDLAERLALYAMVLATFPDAPIMANRVVWAESIGDWNLNWRCTVYGGCWSPTSDCGLMQTNEIHAGRYAAHGWNIYVDCFDPVKNLVISREIFDAAGGPSPWTTSR